MKRVKNNYFMIELPLITEIWQEDIIDKRLECGRNIFNKLLGKTLIRYKEMLKTKRYRNLIQTLHDPICDKDLIWEEINELLKEYKLTHFDIVKDVKPMQHHFKKHLHSQICQEIADRVWKSISSIFHKQNRKVHFKKFNQFNSLSGKQARTGICFKNEYIDWTGLNLKIKYPTNGKPLNYLNNHLFPCLNNLKYCKIVRKYIRCKRRYYVQMVFQGEDVKSRYSVGFGRVGIDIGTSTIAIVSDSRVELLELASNAQKYEQEKKIVQRKLDISRRSTNPNKFNIDGTIKKGNRDKWIKSKNYLKLEKQLKELNRKQRVARNLSHNILTNFILSLGDQFFVEEMNFAGLAKRSKRPTERRKDGKCKKKKRFGKSICNRAPAMLLEILNRKLNYFGLQLNKINTQKCKASQYNHITKIYTPKTLSERWTFVGGHKLQRDLYSAFLISNVTKDLESFDQQLCEQNFNNFLYLHDDKINELTKYKESNNYKFLSCMGI